jgi:glyoxylase-like metal-dependent hydrolase (beta-lactamase superfamily II)
MLIVHEQAFKVHQLQIPTGLRMGPVNVHLIAADPLTLVDTGPLLDASYDALEVGLRDLGYRIDQIERIVLTHMHEDHCGLAGSLQRISGATIFAHPWEAARLRAFDYYNLYVPLMERAGVPADVLESFHAAHERYRQLGEELEEYEGIDEGDVINFGPGSFEVIHTPGHTPGSCCLYRAADRSLIAADTVLRDITPNPVLSPDPLDPSRRFPSLGEYLVSLAKLRSLCPTLVKGGHGPDVTDFEEWFTRIVRFTDERQRTLLGLLSPSGSTAWEACLALFPKVTGDARFLALSETVAHLDFGVMEGRMAVDWGVDAEMFRPLKSPA